MVISAAQMLDEVLPHEPMRQWVLSLPFPLRFVRQPTSDHGQGAEYRLPYPRHASDQKSRFYEKDSPDGRGNADPAIWIRTQPEYSLPHAVSGRHLRRWRQWVVPVPLGQGAELTQLAHTIAQRVGRFLERQGLLTQDAENSYLASDAVDEDPMTQLLGHSITYRIAVSPQQGRKVFTLQTLPACDPEDQFGGMRGWVAEFSLKASVAAKAHQREKREGSFR